MMNVMQHEQIDSPDATGIRVYSNPGHMSRVRGVLESE